MLKNILIVVSDIEKAKRFYQEVFSLRVVNDFGDNVILTEGLVLQEQKSWEQLMGSDMVTGNASELFFVEDDLDAFLHLLGNFPSARIIKDVRENSWGKRVVMLQDPDGHWIEVAER